MKYSVLIFILFILSSCVSDRKVLDSWVNKNIHDVMLRLGSPDQISPDADNGSIYLFSSESYGMGIYAGRIFYTYIFFYAKSDGTIYHWMEKKGSIPPQQINVDMYVHH
jgi:hypothetical protein